METSSFGVERLLRAVALAPRVAPLFVPFFEAAVFDLPEERWGIRLERLTRVAAKL